MSFYFQHGNCTINYLYIELANNNIKNGKKKEQHNRNTRENWGM